MKCPECESSMRRLLHEKGMNVYGCPTCRRAWEDHFSPVAGMALNPKPLVFSQRWQVAADRFELVEIDPVLQK